MRFNLSLILSLASIVAAAAPPEEKKCTTKFRGSPAQLQAAQQRAIAEFGRLFLVERDVQKAFDLYIPGEYINHNPGASSGRQFALDFLIPVMALPTLTTQNITIFGGEGFGMLHYKLGIDQTSIAVMDKYRFEGTCIVEHWDVTQVITGTETNPIAYF